MGRRSGFERPCRRHVRSMLTAWTLLLQVAVSDADAQTLTPPRKTDVDVKTMTEYWAGCTRSCWEKQKLTPEQRLMVKRLQEEHRRTFANFPRTRSILHLTTSGLTFREYPSLMDYPDEAKTGPLLVASIHGACVFSFR